MTIEVLRSLDLLVLFDDHDETISTHTIPEATGMTRITLNIFDVTPLRAFAIATVLSLAFTPLAAQETNCDGWKFDRQFWKAATVDTVSDCLNSGANVNARNEDGSTPFHLAAFFNENPEVLTVLLDAGADINARVVDGSTTLHLAAGYNENPEVFTALLDAGADLNARDEDGSTPFHLAAFFNENPEVIIALLDAGADGTAVNGDGETPFDLAQYNEALAGTDAYWALNDARFE